MGVAWEPATVHADCDSQAESFGCEGVILCMERWVGETESGRSAYVDLLASLPAFLLLFRLVAHVLLTAGTETLLASMWPWGHV
jgi:hypothetical protein